jgi:hypothetical protein
VGIQFKSLGLKCLFTRQLCQNESKRAPAQLATETTQVWTSTQLTIEPGHPDGLDEYTKEDGCAGCKVIQQCEDIDAPLEKRETWLNGGPGCDHFPHENAFPKRYFIYTI